MKNEINVFENPSLLGFDDYRHVTGVRLPVTGELHELQEDVIQRRFPFSLDERRNSFVHLEGDPNSEIEEALSQVLLAEVRKVSEAVLKQTGRFFSVDQKHSAIWIETRTCHLNERIHRDADSSGIIRATFSVSPTRLLSSDAVVPIDEKSWNANHFPMGPTVLGSDFERHVKSVDSEDYSGLMTGTTYHRAPRKDEIRNDFQRVYGQGIPEVIPRVFGSIWGKLS